MKFRAATEAAIHEWCDVPFSWGGSDCLLALADIILEVKGYDPAKIFRGRYKTAIGAVRVTREFGGFGGALAAMARRRRWISIEPAQAQSGDIGLCGKTGVIRYEARWVARTLGTGFASVDSRLVTKAWRVR